ncbi:hypothetical protein CEY09_15530 [Achromobacter marplatensis]|uniref:Uncharacterized protein n=1 Tax=Achromobacter marplatensis TaxID=470868 RepID=A0ABX9GBJ0_9BURK|nr:hypothetical protein [Achromobacter marplatensis]OWT66912.1 hypothetical protein CEY09_15530 [Achromobacter marplatensis]RBP18977.1 hypothetical protein DFP87_10554 [Achromobacter marplatensis]CAB3694243.1 hypothetical protein LMG26219_05000 [Achromobacter marplatensis]
MGSIPSCDYREDAIRSLSDIYAVSTEQIDIVLRNPEVLKIADVYSQINSPGFHFVVCHLLKASPRADITHACYYHSTSYDGCPSWFDEGLLGSSQGVGRFLDKITEWLPLEKQLVAKQYAKGIVKLRSELEGTAAEKCGPYAWNTFTAASSSPSGVRYRVPEAIQDLWVPSFIGQGGVVDLSGIIEERLKPVVVKFKGTISNIDDYCATLWAYLLSDYGECHLTHTFRGNGSAIPKEDIVALMDVP